MRLWVDIANAAGIKQGKGPVWALTGASITRALDGAGTISIDAPGTEERVVSLMHNERRCVIKSEVDGEVRILGEGILRQRNLRGTSSNWTLSANGPDLLDLLKRENTLLARVYSGMTVEDIAQDLAGLAGWTASVEAGIASEIVPVRFDGQTVLKALQMLAAMKGYHLRHDGGTQVEMGLFGTNNGMRLINAKYAHPRIHTNPKIMLVESIGVTENSEGIFNWILPVGGGEGESAITLEYSTRTSPYTVQSMTVSGKTIYYLSDSTSIAKYGTIKKVGRFKQIMPISNTAADLTAASNALYDAAVAALHRNKQSLITYTVSVKNVKQTINVGDKVRLSYRGFIENDEGMIVNYCDVDEDLWVMKATERHTGTALTLSLTLSNVDRHEQSVAEIIVGTLESIEMRGLMVQPYPTQLAYVYRKELDATHTAIVPIEISNAVMFLNQARLTLRSRPFRATAKSEAPTDITSSSAGHDHVTMRVNDVGAPTTGFTARTFSIKETGTNTTYYLQLPTTAPATTPRTFSTVTDGAHTHTVPQYVLIHGIQDDTQYPMAVGIKINGIDRTAALGGPWAPGPLIVAIDIKLDITAYLVTASGGLQQTHQIELFCASGQGEIEVIVELRETIQSIAVN